MINKNKERELQRLIEIVRKSFVDYEKIIDSNDEQLRRIVMQHEATITTLLDIIKLITQEVLEISNLVNDKKKLGK